MPKSSTIIPKLSTIYEQSPFEVQEKRKVKEHVVAKQAAAR